MSDFKRDSFIFGLTRKQLMDFREENYIGYLYMKFQQINGVDDTDTKCFYDFLSGKYDSLNDSDFTPVKITIQHCIWTVSDKFPGDWGYNSFKNEHRSNQINKII